ncbi:unnamed protein product [Amoebophrya sp. A120]|nr:unnamed protein product [Amoebophrya sp. A120]|eukprot:GSA120T00003569001.1
MEPPPKTKTFEILYLWILIGSLAERAKRDTEHHNRAPTCCARAARYHTGGPQGVAGRPKICLVPPSPYSRLGWAQDFAFLSRQKRRRHHAGPRAVSTYSSRASALVLRTSLLHQTRRNPPHEIVIHDNDFSSIILR